MSKENNNYCYYYLISVLVFRSIRITDSVHLIVLSQYVLFLKTATNTSICAAPKYKYRVHEVNLALNVVVFLFHSMHYVIAFVDFRNYTERKCYCLLKLSIV